MKFIFILSFCIFVLFVSQTSAVSTKFLQNGPENMLAAETGVPPSEMGGERSDPSIPNEKGDGQDDSVTHRHPDMPDREPDVLIKEQERLEQQMYQNEEQKMMDNYYGHHD